MRAIISKVLKILIAPVKIFARISIFKTKKIRTKIILSLIPVVLPMLIIIGVTYRITSTASLASSERITRMVADNGAASLNTFIKSQESKFQDWTRDDIYGLSIEYKNLNQLSERFQEIIASSPEFVLLALTDNKGKVLQAYGKNSDGKGLIGKTADETAYLSNELRHSLVLSDSSLLKALDEPFQKTFIFAFCSHDSAGRINGKLLAYLDWSEIQLRVSNMQVILDNNDYPDGQSALIDNNTYLILAHSTSERILTDLKLSAAAREWFNKIDFSQKMSSHDVDNKKQYVIAKPILPENRNVMGIKDFQGDNSGVNIVLTVPDSNIFHEVQKMLLISIAIGGAGIIILLLLIWTTANGIAKPISMITKLITEIAEGRADLTKKVQSHSRDEVGQLAASSNMLTQNLYQLAQTAEKVAGGDLNTSVTVRSDKDTLSISFNKMVVGLNQSTGEMQRMITELNNSTKELLVVLSRLKAGMLDVRANEHTNNDRFNQLGKAMNAVIDSQLTMIEAAKRIADGNLNETIKVRSKEDELSIAFNLMVSNLKGLVLKVKEQANIIVNSSRTLAEVSEHSSQTVEQLSSMTDQISASTTMVAENTQNASNASLKAKDSSQTGKELMMKLVDKIRIVREVEKQSAKVMNDLSISSSRIGEFVGVITKISDQTNLLALNATIEAARAGEAGLGFAVVADEVRKLAESSANSAQEISLIINDVKEETRKAIVSVQEGNKKIDESAQLTEQSDGRFIEIAAQVENIAALIEAIAVTASETAASSEEAAASSKEQAIAMKEIASTATSLSASSDVLLKAIDRFNC